jgi:outer membrane translocation and assembly module TamA
MPNPYPLRPRSFYLGILLIGVAFGAIPLSSAQSAKPLAPTPPIRYPYIFSNFPWWTDSEVRVLLKRRIPSLTDEIAPNFALESKIRTALTDLLSQKGIHAAVQSFDPSPDAGTAQRVTGAPPPSIRFSILGPPDILVDTVTFEGAPPDADTSFDNVVAILKGQPFEAGDLWFEQQQIVDRLQVFGYLSAAASITAGQPTKDGDRYLVPLAATINAGPRYRVASIKVDGGPLFEGSQIAPSVPLKPGDLANATAFIGLANYLRPIYLQDGYLDAEFDPHPTLDKDRALVSYDFTVTPGPLYRVRTVTIENLNPAQEQQARSLLGLRPGDAYDELTVMQLHRRLSEPESTLKDYSFSYSRHADKSTQTIDLILSFYADKQ